MVIEGWDELSDDELVELVQDILQVASDRGIVLMFGDYDDEEENDSEEESLSPEGKDENSTVH